MRPAFLSLASAIGHGILLALYLVGIFMLVVIIGEALFRRTFGRRGSETRARRQPQRWRSF